MTLVCARTAREFPVQSYEAAKRAAEHLGIKDWTLKPAPRRPETNIGE